MRERPAGQCDVGQLAGPDAARGEDHDEPGGPRDGGRAGDPQRVVEVAQGGLDEQRGGHVGGERREIGAGRRTDARVLDTGA